MKMANKPLIVVAGPTAAGKTAASIKIAKHVGGEIISADSMQVYKGMDIGTAKLPLTEMQGIPHYLIDEIYPDEEYNACIFQQRAKTYIEKIYENGKVPIIVGGTGFYINVLIYDNDFVETTANLEFRNNMSLLAEKNGNTYIHNLLREKDPAAADDIHPNNAKKVIRALEYFEQTGTKISEHNKAQKCKQSPYDVKLFVLSMDRAKLYERIETRVDIMLKCGLVLEVEKLLNAGYGRQLVSMQGLGYKEIAAHLHGEIYLEEAVRILKRNTRHFAKRQLTWFRHQTNGVWIDSDKPGHIEEILQIFS